VHSTTTKSTSLRPGAQPCAAPVPRDAPVDPGIKQLPLLRRYSQEVTEYEGAPGAAFLDALDLYRKNADITKLGPLLQRARDEVEMLTILTVKRAMGRETWKTIGDALGTSRQAATKKYGSL
jgi:hypothetical protein